MGYTSAGRPKWRTLLAGYRGSLVLELPDNGFSVQLPDDGYHHLLSLFVLKEGTVLAQLGFSEGGTARRYDFDSLLSVAIDMRTGLGSFLGSGLPRLVVAQDGELIELAVDPYWRLTRRRWNVTIRSGSTGGTLGDR